MYISVETFLTNGQHEKQWIDISQTVKTIAINGNCPTASKTQTNTNVYIKKKKEEDIFNYNKNVNTIIILILWIYNIVMVFLKVNLLIIIKIGVCSFMEKEYRNPIVSLE